MDPAIAQEILYFEESPNANVWSAYIKDGLQHHNNAEGYLKSFNYLEARDEFLLARASYNKAKNVLENFYGTKMRNCTRKNDPVVDARFYLTCFNIDAVNAYLKLINNSLKT